MDFLVNYKHSLSKTAMQKRYDDIGAVVFLDSMQLAKNLLGKNIQNPYYLIAQDELIQNALDYVLKNLNLATPKRIEKIYLIDSKGICLNLQDKLKRLKNYGMQIEIFTLNLEFIKLAPLARIYIYKRW